MRAFVLKVVLRIRNIFYRLNWNDSERFPKQSCAVGLTVFASKRIKCNSLLVSLFSLQI